MFAASSKKVFLKDKKSCINKRRTSQLSALNSPLSALTFTFRKDRHIFVLHLLFRICVVTIDYAHILP